MKTLLLAALAAGILATPIAASAEPGGRHHRVEVRHERHEIRHDRREMRRHHRHHEHRRGHREFHNGRWHTYR